MTNNVYHILLIEDDEDDYLIISKYFREINDNEYKIEWCKTYEKAIAILEKIESPTTLAWEPNI